VERPRNLQVAAFIAALSWYFCAKALAASAATGIGSQIDLGMCTGVLRGAFEVFLVVVGVGLLSAIERRRAPLRLSLGLPSRGSARTEWAEGVALGWGAAIVCVLPLLLSGSFDVRLWSAPRAWQLAIANVLALALLSLAQALGVYGYSLQRLIEAIGPTRATIVLSLLAALYTGLNPNSGGATGIRVLVALLGTILFCLCWIRTHAVWLLWGLHFAWSSAVGVLFGLPLAGSTNYSSVVESRSFGPLWLTGGDYGPGAGLATAVCILAAIVVLVRITSDYAWNYTRPVIIPAGFEVDIPPPAAHTDMEAAPAPPPPLVQILPTTSAPPKSDSPERSIS
jgi:membrane protease YdiL (CAAX protease family)